MYSVEYCKARFKWYSGRKVETSSLGETKWKIRGGVQTGTDEVEDDVVEAEVDDNPEFGDNIL